VGADVTALTIYCNADLPPAALERLRREVLPHRLIFPTSGARAGVLEAGQPDPQLGLVEVAFGQPDVDQVIVEERLAWVHLTSAGYTRYDRPDLTQAFRRRGAALTNSSQVYSEPCALHVLAFMCAQARQLPPAWNAQRGAHEWRQQELRARCHLLDGESVVMVGFGSIARRLVELLAPLHMRLCAIRRRVIGDEPVPTYAPDDPRAVQALAGADHVIDVLPANASTNHFFDAQRFAGFKSGAIFYNIGRGTTVSEDALQSALASGHLGAAYLDVTSAEPLPPTHPLWSAPNCFITPHTAGGHQDESLRLVQHFLDNLARFMAGQPLVDRVV
jgi:phosphoglycerate dehydrogenase-like enzyme